MYCTYIHMYVAMWEASSTVKYVHQSMQQSHFASSVMSLVC